MKLFKIAALGVALSSATLLIASDALAMPYQSYMYIYYSDATMTEVVGAKSLDCSGARGSTGIQTIYVESRIEKCTIGAGPGFPG